MHSRTQPAATDHHLLVQDVLHDLAQVRELLLGLLEQLLLLLVSGSSRPSLVTDTSVPPSHSFSCCTQYSLHEGRVPDHLLALAGDEEDALLVLLHARDVVAERAHLVARGGRVEAQQGPSLLWLVETSWMTSLRFLLGSAI